jgi:aspartyl aminopeptidase
MPGGSTLGSIANTKVPLLTVDVGVPQLAMHSSSEVCCEKDALSLEKILSELYSVNLSIDSKKISVE